MHAGILHHAVAGANLLAHIHAERLFFGVGHRSSRTSFAFLAIPSPLLMPPICPAHEFAAGLGPSGDVTLSGSDQQRANNLRIMLV